MQRQENNVYYAGFFVRLAAVLLDNLFIGLILFIVKFLFLFISIGGMTGSLVFSEVLFQFTVWDIIYYLLSKGYFIATTYSAGATLGKKLMKIKVVTAEGIDLELWNVLYRETIGKYISGLFLGIGYVTIGIDREKRGFHDMLCDTLVIYNLNDLQIVDVAGQDTGICEIKNPNKETDMNSKQPANPNERNDLEIYYRRSEESQPTVDTDKKEKPTYKAASYGYVEKRKEETNDDKVQDQQEGTVIENPKNKESED